MSDTIFFSVGAHPDKRVKSKYLYVERGGRVIALARFMSEEAAQEYLDLMVPVFKGQRSIGTADADDNVTITQEARNALQRAFDVRD